MKEMCEDWIVPTVEIKADFFENNYFMREALNTIRANFLFSGYGVKTVAITSCHMSEGKSTVTLALARSLAELDKRVLLVDADLRKSVLPSRLEGMIEKGLTHYLSGQAELDEALYHTQYENLDILLAGKEPPSPVVLLDSSRMKDLLIEMREKYDYILIDTPPLGMVIDGAVMAKYADGVIMVLEAGSVQDKEAQAVKSQLEKSGCRLLGVILNHTGKKSKKGSRLLDCFARFKSRFFSKNKKQKEK